MQGVGGEYWEERVQLKDLGADAKIILKWISKKRDGGHGLD
jgi:hypothetical protein